MDVLSVPAGPQDPRDVAKEDMKVGQDDAAEVKPASLPEAMEMFKYIPVEHLEDLIVRAKRALKIESRLLKERAQIEEAYAKSLESWASEFHKKISDYEPYDLKNIHSAVVHLLQEGEGTAAKHRSIAERIASAADQDRPVNMLNKYKKLFFQHDLVVDTVYNKGRTLHEFSRLFDRYKDAVTSGRQLLTNAEKKLGKDHNEEVGDDSVEKGLDQVLGGLAKKFTLSRGGAKTEDTTPQTVLRNRLRYLIHMNMRTINTVIENITSWEKRRLVVSTDALIASFDAISDLGVQCAPICGSGAKIVQQVDPEAFVREWVENHTESLGPSISEVTYRKLLITPQDVTQALTQFPFDITKREELGQSHTAITAEESRCSRVYELMMKRVSSHGINSSVSQETNAGDDLAMAMNSSGGMVPVTVSADVPLHTHIMQQIKNELEAKTRGRSPTLGVRFMDHVEVHEREEDTLQDEQPTDRDRIARDTVDHGICMKTLGAGLEGMVALPLDDENEEIPTAQAVDGGLEADIYGTSTGPQGTSTGPQGISTGPQGISTGQQGTSDKLTVELNPEHAISNRSYNDFGNESGPSDLTCLDAKDLNDANATANPPVNLDHVPTLGESLAKEFDRIGTAPQAASTEAATVHDKKSKKTKKEKSGKKEKGRKRSKSRDVTSEEKEEGEEGGKTDVQASTSAPFDAIYMMAHDLTAVGSADVHDPKIGHLPDAHPFYEHSGRTNILVYALTDHLKATRPDEMTFTRGQKIRMKYCDPKQGEGWGFIKDAGLFSPKIQGRFPLRYVDTKPPPADEESHV